MRLAKVYTVAAALCVLVGQISFTNATASDEAIQAVLLEELGHAIDHRLNINNDTPGDEGAIFSALIRGVAIPVLEANQNDHYTLIINGQRIAVEAAAPTFSSAATNNDGTKGFNH